MELHWNDSETAESMKEARAICSHVTLAAEALCFSTVRKQRLPTYKLSKKPRPPMPAPSGRPKLLALWPTGMLRPRGPLRASYFTGNITKPSETWSNKSSMRKAEAKLTSSLPVRLPYMPAQWTSKVCW